MSTDKQCDCDACAVVFRLAGPDVAASGDDDILDRLRHQWNGEYAPTGRLLSEAADEIERLRSDLQTMVAETQSLIALITTWADAYDRVEDEWALGDGSELVAYYTALNALRKAVGR